MSRQRVTPLRAHEIMIYVFSMGDVIYLIFWRSGWYGQELCALLWEIPLIDSHACTRRRLHAYIVLLNNSGWVDQCMWLANTLYSLK